MATYHYFVFIRQGKRSGQVCRFVANNQTTWAGCTNCRVCPWFITMTPVQQDYFLLSSSKYFSSGSATAPVLYKKTKQKGLWTLNKKGG